MVSESRMVNRAPVVIATRCPRITHSWIIRNVLSLSGVIFSQGYMMKQMFMVKILGMALAHFGKLRAQK
jgi:hypothetical protein